MWVRGCRTANKLTPLASLYSVQGAMYSDMLHFIMYTVPCQFYSVHYIVHREKYILRSKVVNHHLHSRNAAPISLSFHNPLPTHLN